MTSLDRTATFSLGSVLLTDVAITVNHLYVLGPKALVLGATLSVLPAILLWWYERSASRAALMGYMVMNAWIVVGFGFLKGWWGITLPLFLGSLLANASASFPNPSLGVYGWEASGILMFVGSLFVLYYASLMVQKETQWSRSSNAVFAGGVVALIIFAGVFAFRDRDKWTAPNGGIVRIGVLAPTTGPYSILGTSFVKAVEMARADLPKTSFNYELVIRDPGPDPTQAGPVVRKLIDEENVDAVIGAVSLIGQVTKPYATRARIPHLCVCTVASIADGAYNFTNIPSPAAEAKRWVAEAQRRNVKSVAIVYQDYPSINNHVKALKAEAERVGLPIVYEKKFSDTVSDFASIISEAGRSNPDIYYVEALNPALDRLGQQLSDARVRNISSVVAPSLSEKPELFEGVWYTDSDLASMEFKRRFERKYPGVQFATHMMPYAYDSFNMIVRAYEQRTNPAVYIRSVRSYTGSAGKVTKEARSGLFTSTPAVWMIRNGKPILLKGVDQLSLESERR